MQLKHLFVFLLVLVISVAESNVYSQESNSSYYQSSKIIKKKNLNSKNTKHIVFNYTLSGNSFFTFFFPSTPQKNILQEQTQLTIKLQKQLYQKIASLNIQHIFLITKITSSNSLPSTYIV